MGYNGTLVGCAFSVFLGATAPTALAATVVGAAASAPLTAAIGKAMSPVPGWTLAFNATALAALVFVKPLAGASASGAAPLAVSAMSAADFISSLLTGVSQIFVVNNPIAGALMLAGIAAYSPSAAAATLLGSLMGVLVAVVVGADMNEVKDGLWGFNPALTGLAVSVFFVPSGMTLLLVCGGAAATAVLTMGMKDVAASTLQVPSLTLPFCAAATGCFLLGGRVPGLLRASAPHSPEVNLRAFRASCGK